jgi:hypothetical protein
MFCFYVMLRYVPTGNVLSWNAQCTIQKYTGGAALLIICNEDCHAGLQRKLSNYTIVKDTEVFFESDSTWGTWQGKALCMGPASSIGTLCTHVWYCFDGFSYLISTVVHLHPSISSRFETKLSADTFRNDNPACVSAYNSVFINPTDSKYILGLQYWASYIQNP